ncbi:MAG: hypothetical protein ACT4OY_03290 [Alphaproteobacteria bacterium]
MTSDVRIVEFQKSKHEWAKIPASDPQKPNKVEEIEKIPGRIPGVGSMPNVEGGIKAAQKIGVLFGSGPKPGEVGQGAENYRDAKVAELTKQGHTVIVAYGLNEEQTQALKSKIEALQQSGRIPASRPVSIIGIDEKTFVLDKAGNPTPWKKSEEAFNSEFLDEMKNGKGDAVLEIFTDADPKTSPSYFSYGALESEFGAPEALKSLQEKLVPSGAVPVVNPTPTPTPSVRKP